MKVMIKETGKVETIRWMENGINILGDMIGNYDGYGTEPHQFERIDEFGYDFTASQDTVDWWEKVARDGEELYERIQGLNEEYGSEAVHAVVSQAAAVDLEDLAAAVNKALDEEFGEGK
ncbi:hypothetical protein RB620_24520 [Paenibacillus sp. LHD-117]|uniref:hypothetical protein n=1 Tax=Paenibacillus sp. LHD-117 TaxID=3071412 RepID=UPI0027DF6052|nr:hypothetical protein [Paenibacillus sp. LHD-117]MDQ6422601.1 hypothetical protein [Paenibacillus sp. LHD-117]